MRMTTKAVTDRVHATRVKVQQLRGQLAEVEADKAVAEAELVDLDARVGVEAVDSPKTVAQSLKDMQTLRDRAMIADRSIEILVERIRAAESEYLLAEAEVLDAPIEAARRKLAQHQARTDELLKLLADHEGPFVPEDQLIREKLSNPAVLRPGMEKKWTVGRSVVMQQEIEAMEVGPRILRELAAGVDPGGKLALYPACVASEDALVKAPAYLRSLTREHQAVEATPHAVS